MRRKTRITIVAVIFLILLVGGGGAILFRQHRMDQNALASRARGMEAAKADNYKDALHQIGTYLQRFDDENDAEALYEYGRARLNIPLPNGKHIQQAIGFYIRAVEIDPNLEKAQHDLLDLYVSAGYSQEALTLAEKLRAKNPDDVEALRAESKALAKTRKFDDALVKTARVAELEPLDIANHMLAVAIRNEAKASKEDILAYPASQKALNPEEHPFQLVQAIALEITGDSTEARNWAKRASTSIPADSKDVPLVNGMLNQFGLFDDSMKLLARAVPASDNPDLKQLYCQRLFEGGDIPAVLAQTEGQPYPEMRSAILAVRAMASGRENNTEEIKKIVAELDSRSDDALADAWAPVLSAIWLSENQSPDAVVRICATAIESDPGNPYFHYFQGLAYEQLGEKQQALTSWQKAATFSQGWVDPIVRVASLLASTGRTAEAVQVAKELQQRAPTSVTIAAATAEIIGANISALPEADQTSLLKLCQQVQTAIPFEPRTLPLVVELLARQGANSTAADTLKSALESEQKFPEGTLLKLAELSDKHNLGLSDACLERLGTAGGSSPALAYAQAVSLLKSGDPEKGREQLASAAAAAGNDLQWQVLTAQYLELMGSEDAVSAWAAIADAAPENAIVLNRVLNSKAAWDDTAAITRAIENLKKLTGESGTAWRAAQARLLLLTDESPKAAAEAATLLNDTLRLGAPEADRYVLLANALKRLSNNDGAIDALKRATEVAPEASAIRFELIDMLQARGRTDEIATQIELILNAKNPDPNALRRTAALLASQNKSDQAVAMLLKLHPAEDQLAPKDLLLAQIYRRAGQTEKAAAICKRFLDEEPNAGVVQFSADLFASQGQTEEAKAALARLDGLGLEPGARESILADYERTYGTPEEAARLYQEAVAAAKDNPSLWRRMLSFYARAGELDQVMTRIPEASLACPNDESLKSLNSQIELLKSTQPNPMARPFVVAALENPEVLPQAVSALQALQKDTDPTALADTFRKLADENPNFLPVKMQLVRLYASLNRHDDAAALASQAMTEFPGEIEPAVLAARAFEAQGRWAEAMEAAKQWRLRAPGNQVDADLVIANAQIGLNQSTDALATIEPYLAQNSEDPNAYSGIVANQARALIHTDRVAEAADLLRPRLAASNPWRMAWLQLAALDIPSHETAAAWLNEVSPLFPDDADDERLALASAWHQISERTEQPAYRDNARTILQALAARPDASGSTLLALAIVAERDRDYGTAESLYKRALELDQSLIAARNNLAMRYIVDKKNLPEALALAQEAANAAPTNANCLDTLAEAQAANGDLDGAMNSIGKAIELEPENTKWLEQLARFKQMKDGAASEAPVVN